MPPLSRFWPAAAFAVLTLALFGEFVFSDRMLVGQDTFSLGYVARAFFANALRTTGFPLWNPQILGGTPFLESLAGGDSLYPPSLILLFLTETYRSLGWKLVLHVFLAGSFMYLWIRVLGGSRGAAFVSGVSYLLAPYLVTLVYPGHDGKLFVTALTPLLFAAAEAMFRRAGLLAGAGLAAVVALVILTTHFQMAYFLFGATGLYAAFRSVQIARQGTGSREGARRFGVFLMFSVLGAAIAAIQLVPAVDYVTEHSRRTLTTATSNPEDALAYSSSWSLHWEEVVGLVVPEFVGSSAGGAEWTTATYWGRNAFKLNHEYLGVVALLLAAISLIGGPHRPLRRFMLGLGAFAGLFALGAHTPVWRVLYEILPGISLFRAPSMAIFLTGFAVATLAGLGVDRGLAMLEEGKGERLVRLLLACTGVLGAGALLAVTGVLTGIWVALLSPENAAAGADALARARPFIVRGFFVATALGAATTAVWWSLQRRFLAPTLGVVALALLVAIDEFRVDAPFIQTVPYEAFWAADGNDLFLQERMSTEEPFRVLSLVGGGQDVRPAAHGIELAAGHHPNDLARYRELIGMEGSGVPEHLAGFNQNLLRILNVRYIVWPDEDAGPLGVPGVEPSSQLQYPDGRIARSVYAYPGLPRARLVGEAVVVPEDRTVETILDPAAYDPATQVVLNEEPPIALGGPGLEGTVAWVERVPNRLALDVTASAPALLVLSENWFPAWRATVDGASAPVLRADHSLRAVPVPAGTHRVELRYQSRLLGWSLATSAAAKLVLLGCLIVGLRGRKASV